MTVLSIIVLTLTFEALLFGSELAESSFPDFDEPESPGFFSAIDSLAGIVQGVWGVVLFIVNLLTFNIPGAPFWIRIPLGSIMGGGLIWSIATLIRGN